jgi:hypothetical protein
MDSRTKYWVAHILAGGSFAPFFAIFLVPFVPVNGEGKTYLSAGFLVLSYVMWYAGLFIGKEHVIGHAEKATQHARRIVRHVKRRVSVSVRGRTPENG